MSTTPALSDRGAIVVLVPLLLLIAVVAWWLPDHGSDAASPAPRASTSQAGRITFDTLPGSTSATLALRSFSAGGSNDTSGTGVGKFVADPVSVVLDASGIDPLLLRAAATGVHLKQVTLTLFAPGTTRRQQVWDLDSVTVSEVRTSQAGSAKAPRLTLGLGYGQVTETTYDAKGKISQRYCFNLAQSAAC